MKKKLTIEHLSVTSAQTLVGLVGAMNDEGVEYRLENEIPARKMVKKVPNISMRLMQHFVNNGLGKVSRGRIVKLALSLGSKDGEAAGAYLVRAGYVKPSRDGESYTITADGKRYAEEVR